MTDKKNIEFLKDNDFDSVIDVLSRRLWENFEHWRIGQTAIYLDDITHCKKHDIYFKSAYDPECPLCKLFPDIEPKLTEEQYVQYMKGVGYEDDKWIRKNYKELDPKNTLNGEIKTG